MDQPTKTKRLAGSRLARHKSLVAYSFILPNYLGFAVFTLIPVVCSVLLSFMKWNGSAAPEWIGLDNYIGLFANIGKLSDSFGPALRNTIVYTALSVPLTMACSLGLALLLNSQIRGRDFFRTIAFFPYIASLIAVSTVFKLLFIPNDNGLINGILKAVSGFTVKWTTEQWGIYFMAILFSIWKNMGYYMVIYLAGLQGVNKELYESAALDGASKWQRFVYVTIPEISLANFFVMIMLIVNSFKVYDVFYQLFAGPDNVLGKKTTILVYEIFAAGLRGNNNFGKASAISMVLFALVLAVTLIQFRGERRFTNR
ncbi:MAG: sugar ABC transporter permease [Lachnospiraceae bacterium]|jgi:multiple sugar transport system permease protein|nr:sugar ABC transporter permease [Lachnospiraceae bacterium]